MSYANLSLEQTPPLSVPLPYFLAAPLFAAAAGVWLALDPELLRNRWLPGSLGLTHLLTLGFLAMVMAGALQQLLPVLVGAPLPRVRTVSRVVCAALVAGSIALVAGLAGGPQWATRTGMLLLALAFAVLVFAGAWALSSARSTHATVGAMAAALGALLITAGLGLHLAAAHGFDAALPRHLTDVHAAWGLVGWVGLLVIGVAWQVVPMFQLTPDYPKPLMNWLVPGLFAGLVAWSALVVAAPLAPGWAAWPVGAALAGFAGTTLWLQARRRRRLADVTLDFWRVGMASLLLAVLVWAGAGLAGAPVPERLIGVLFIVGFGVSVVSGMLYKIVPFLVWLHLNNRIHAAARPQGRIPNMKQVIPAAPTRLHFVLHGLAVLMLAAATLWPQWLAMAAGLVFAAASLVQAWNLFGAARCYRRVLAELYAGEGK